MQNELKAQKIEESVNNVLKQSFKDSLSVGRFIPITFLVCLLSYTLSSMVIADLLMAFFFVPFFISKKHWVEKEYSLKNIFLVVFVSKQSILVFATLLYLVSQISIFQIEMSDFSSFLSHSVREFFIHFSSGIFLFLFFLYVLFLPLKFEEELLFHYCYWNYFENNGLLKYLNVDLFNLIKQPILLVECIILVYMEVCAFLFIKFPFKIYLLLTKNVENIEISNKLFKDFFMLNRVFFLKIIFLIFSYSVLTSLLLNVIFLQYQSIYNTLDSIIGLFGYIWCYTSMINMYHLGFGGNLEKVKQEEETFDKNMAFNF